MRTWAYERKFVMPVKPLPPNANLDHLKHQAKDLIKAHAEHDLQAAQRIREFHPRFKDAADATIFHAEFKLADAQLAVARERGFPSWTRLKRHIEKPTLADRLNLPHHGRIEDPLFRRAVDLLDAGDAEGLRVLLHEHPHLARQQVVFEGGNYFQNPSLLEFIAENPIRHGSLPQNIVQVAKTIVDVGVDQSALNEALMLVSTGCVPRKCHAQIPLINLLCDSGANPDAAIHSAALHGERAAVHALIERGARVDLPIAAALGRTEDARRLLPRAGAEARHLALTMAADSGHVEIVRLLLDAGEDPNRYNPVGGHSHTTPLHQAAGAGHEDVVRLLVERGARLDMKDIMWQATPAGWARHAGRTDIEGYLHQQGARSEKLGKGDD
jgi:hypothetical protein